MCVYSYVCILLAWYYIESDCFSILELLELKLELELELELEFCRATRILS